MTRLAEGARRLPFTATLVAAVLVVAILARTLWDPLEGQSWRSQVAYGLPAFEDGHWWTVLTGAFFAMRPSQYVPILLGLAVLVGFTEWRLGARRTALVVLGCHVFGVLATAGLLFLVGGHGWDWATELAGTVDAGPSAGFLGGAAAATATLAPPWRGRLRILLASYVVIMLLYVGALFDVEHFFAVALGLFWGPFLVGRRPSLHTRSLTRRDFRLLAAGFMVVAAVTAVVSALAPVSGPLASTMPVEERQRELAQSGGFPLGALILAGIYLGLARGVYKGRRRAWRWTTGFMVFAVLVTLLTGISLAVEDLPGWPIVIYAAITNGAGLAILVAGRRAFRNPSPRRARKTSGHMLAAAGEQQQEAARALLREDGTVNNLSWMTTWPENRWFVPGDPQGYVAYRVHAGVALGLCDPVAADEEDRARLLTAYADTAQTAGLVPCLFSVTEEAARHALGLGWQALQVAEEAVIDLPSLEFKGKVWQDVRTALNQAAKQGIQHRLGVLRELPRGLQMQVRAISEDWVEDKGLPEMGFTLGGVDEAMDPAVRVGLAVDADMTVHGVTSWMPVYGKGSEPVGWTLDVMRRLPDGFRYSMEFLIASACMAFKDEGCRLVSLSGAPLARAGASDSSVDRGPLDGFLDRLGDTLEPYYGFRSLQSFKAKFQPQFKPLFLVFPDEARLPAIGVALSRAYLPDAGLRDLVTLARAKH